MRLWHKDLIHVLPRQQLVSQWRECILIAKNLAENGTPNHVLVNKILDYGSEDFLIYGEKIINEMRSRGYNISYESVQKFYGYNKKWRDRRKEDLKGLKPKYASSGPIFQYWHNKRYLEQCYHNLQEKYDCGAVSEDEFKTLKSCYEHLRLYKYRAKSKDSDKWFEGYYFEMPEISVCGFDSIESEIKSYLMFYQTVDWNLPNKPVMVEIDINTLEVIE